MANLQAKLQKVTLTEETLLQFCERKVKEKSKSIRNKGLGLYDDWIEAFTDLCDKEYIILDDDTLFKVIEWKEDDYFLQINHNSDGTVDMAMSYHGTTHWRDNLDKVDINSLKK